jgi:hypothetical protein
MEVGQKRGISRKMQAKDPQIAMLLPRHVSSIAFARGQHPTAQDRPASQARDQDCRGIRHHARNHKEPTTFAKQAPLPSKRPSVAVHFAPLLCRLLELHYHHSPASSSESISTHSTLPIPQTCPTRSQLPHPPTLSLLPHSRRHKHKTRLWDRPLDRPSRRNRVTM